MSTERERQNEAFYAYLKKHCEGKLRFAELWSNGRMMFRPCTIKWTEEFGEVMTKSTDPNVAEVELRLPPPYNNGVDYDNLNAEDISACLNYVQAEFPWIATTYRKPDALLDAKKNPGVAIVYDASNGYWRSSILTLIKSFSVSYRTGVDPKTDASTKPVKTTKKTTATVKPASSTKTTKKQRLVGGSVAATSTDDADNASDDDEHDVPSPCASVHAGKVKKVEWAPEVEESYVRDARMIISCDSLMKHLKNHDDGDYVKNPYRKLAGSHTLSKTKETQKSHIKKVITEWILTTQGGRKWLRACNLSSGEFTIDRVISRNGKSKGTNCVWNLVLMPSRVNSYFNTNDSQKREYVGEKAWKVANMANDVFHYEAEVEFDFEVACSKKADMIMSSVYP